MTDSYLPHAELQVCCPGCREEAATKFWVNLKFPFKLLHLNFLDLLNPKFLGFLLTFE